ncbi:MAG TPA: TadA family conjugal transfer-associated ATPase [Candidatus Stackebrandtia faecavium]|nr:TadA family conjugal transfer-associated ATPase [Candidatus Stackebrandtia faecavium]
MALVESVRKRLARTAAPVTAAAVVSAVKASPDVAVAGSALLDLAENVGHEIVGAGPLQPLLNDPNVSDVLVNGPGEVWTDDGKGLRLTQLRFDDSEQLRGLATRLAHACGRRLDDAHPCVDARLPDGTRLHAVLPPIARRGPYLSLRTHRARAFDIAALAEAGTLDDTSAEVIRDVVAAGIAYLISGGTGSGKTTLLGAMLSATSHKERIVIVEDSTELAPRHPHVLSLEARGANIEGRGTVAMSVLVKQALRMRPDRIVVGECRGAEIIELLTALNTGHDGGAGTLHANTAADVPARLTALALPHGLSRSGLHALVASALEVVIHMRRTETARVVDEISLLDVDPDGHGIRIVSAWRRESGQTAAYPRLRLLLDRRLNTANGASS